MEGKPVDFTDMTTDERADFARRYGVRADLLPGGDGYKVLTDPAAEYAAELSGRYGVKIDREAAAALLDARKAILGTEAVKP